MAGLAGAGVQRENACSLRAKPSMQGTKGPACKGLGAARPRMQGTTEPSMQGTKGPACKGLRAARPRMQGTMSPACEGRRKSFKEAEGAALKWSHISYDEGAGRLPWGKESWLQRELREAGHHRVCQASQEGLEGARGSHSQENQKDWSQQVQGSQINSSKSAILTWPGNR